VSEHSDFDEQTNDVIDRYLLWLRGAGPEPDLGHLTPSQRRTLRARLEIVDALAGVDPALPPLEDDPVAMRLGLVPDRRGGDDGGGTRDGSGSSEISAASAGASGPTTDRAHDAARRVLDELEASFHGQVIVDWAPSWASWPTGDLEPLASWPTGDLEPLAQCSVLGDALALFVTDRVGAGEELALLATFLHHHPDVSAVGLVSRNASRAAILSAAACNRSVDPVRGWLEPGAFVVTETFNLTLAHYFDQRLPRWERVTGLSELLAIGDFTQDALHVVSGEIDAALGLRPRLEHKKQAQQALRQVDSHAFAALITAVQSGEISGVELAERLARMAEDTL
jgi:hypothetical protein